MSSLVPLRLLLILFLSASTVAVAAEPTRIMPLGDSITDNDQYTSYRRPLWKQLVQANHTVDFVGSLKGPIHNDYDYDHEGHSGWRIDMVNEKVSEWLAAQNPHIVLVHLGTNDIAYYHTTESSIAELGQLIDLIRANNPNMIILLAQIIPNGAAIPEVEELNAEIPGLVTAKTTPESPVILVDQYTGYDALTDNYDLVHPNDSGGAKLAQRWFEQLDPVLWAIENPGVPYPEKPDAGPADAGEPDAGEVDGGPVDAGTLDAGELVDDAGHESVDAGTHEPVVAIEPKTMGPARGGMGCSSTQMAPLVLLGLVLAAPLLRRKHR
jgi:lysophospholipase L1-like esterase